MLVKGLAKALAGALMAGLVALALLAPAYADDAPRKVIMVPPGNRSATQPEISFSAVSRTAETKGSFDGKYQAIYAALAADHALIGKIKAAAATYGIDPIHIIGAIVGEHTFNVDVMDSLQGYYVKALEYLGEIESKTAERVA